MSAKYEPQWWVCDVCGAHYDSRADDGRTDVSWDMPCECGPCGAEMRPLGADWKLGEGPTCDVEATTDAVGQQRIARGERHIELWSLITRDEARSLVRAVLAHVHPQPREEP